MIQIKETDFLWRCYKRFYKYDKNYLDGKQLPHPGSVCKYFWVALGGLIMWLFWDLSIIVYIGLLCLSAYKSNELILPPKIGGLILMISLLVVIEIRVINYLHNAPQFVKKSLAWFACLFVGFIVCGFPSFLSALLYMKSGDSVLWKPLVLGALTWNGTLAIIIGIIWFFASPKSNVLRSYMGALKDKACPLIKAPWESE